MQKLANVTTAILAGGLGTRLRDVVCDKPKVLARVQDRPFLAYLLDYLAATGIHDVVLCTGYMGEQVRSEFGNAYKTIRLRYSRETQLLGTGGALRLALSHFESDPVLVMNGDSIFHTDLSAFWNWHMAAKAINTILLTEMPDTRRYGQVEIDENNQINRFIEKNHCGGPGRINAGIYLLSHNLLQSIPIGQAVSLENDVFPCWAGWELWGYPTQGRFLDIGTPESYRLAQQFFTAKLV